MAHNAFEPAGRSTDRWQAYVDSPELQQRLYRKTLFIVVLSQIFGGLGLAAGVTVGALLAEDMLDSTSLTGVPAALITLGSAASALLVGRLCQRSGRRAGFATGFLAGGAGAVGIVAAAVLGSVPLLFASLLVYGAGTATNLQARYAGTDLAKPHQRATAVSIAMVSTTLGAVSGPNLVEATGRFAESVGAPALAGPFMLSAVAFLLAGFVFLLLLRPDPLLVAKAVAQAAAEAERRARETGAGADDADGASESRSRDGEGASARQARDAAGTAAERAPALRTPQQRGVVVGASVMVLTQIVMVAIMTMTPIHMLHHGHGLHEVGLVIGFHIGAMFLPSLVTGMLVDKLGRTTMSIASGAVLLVAGMLAALAPGDSMWAIVAALTLLGLGWNLGVISGTAIIVDATPLETRAKTQGSIDVLIALVGASGGAASGYVMAQTSYATLSFAGGFLALLLVPVVVWSLRKPKPSPSAAAPAPSRSLDA